MPKRFLSLAGAPCLALCLLLLRFACPHHLEAQTQTTTATLNGTVLDSSGAAVPGASVTLAGADNGISRTVTSDADGRYSFSLLPPSSYNLSVTSAGFKGYKQQGIGLQPGQTASQNVQLTVGTETQEVTVTSQAPLLNTDDANLSAEISAKQVVDLPLNLRNVYGLATLNSSVQNSSEGQKVGAGSSDNADQDISFLNFGGGFFGTTAFLLDGVWDTASDWGAVVYVPSVESVEEFKIQTNSFTSQYGFSTGNVINVVTKSGTSQFHGDVFEFLRNSKLDANNYFNNFNGLAKPSFRRNQFGASGGGPLYIPKLYQQTQKTFVFALYEGLRQSTPFSASYTVPTTAFRTGDFSALLGGQAIDAKGNPITDALGRPVLTGQIYNPFSSRRVVQGQVDPVTGRVAAATGFVRDPYPGNQLAGAVNPVGAALTKYYPAPTNNGLSNNFAAAASSPAQSNEYQIRVDHNISDTSRIFARWSQKFEFKTNYPAVFGASDPGGPGNVRPNNRFNFVIGYNQVLNATTAMSINAGLSRWAEASNSQSYPFNPSNLGLPSTLNANSPLFPLVTTENQASLGPQQGNQGVGYRNVGSVSVDFTKTKGAHSLSFGWMGALMQNNGTGFAQTTFDFNRSFTASLDPNGNTIGNTGFGYASLLIGTPDSGSTANIFNPAITKKYSGFYGQDNWKATQNLTLTRGLRYEWQQPPTERHNQQAYFNPTALNPISSAVGTPLPGELVYNGGGNRRGLYNTTWTNFAPRFGFTEQATKRLVLRGGYGIFFAPQYFGGGYNPGFNQSTPYTASVDGNVTPFTTLSDPFPNGLIPPAGRSLGGLQDVGLSTNAILSNRRSPYIQQYSAGVEYAFTNNDVLTATFVGNHGTKLLQSNFTASQLNPSYLSMGSALLDQVPNPFYGHIANSGCGLNQPTISRGQSMQPFPQYCSVNEPQAPVGFSIYNALQADYNHRFHGGLNMLVSYTFSKFLDNVDGTNDWAVVGSQGIRNYYDLAAEKSVDGNDTPHSLVVNYIYELPVGRGKKVGGNFNRATDAVLGGWQVSGISSFKSGIPLSVSGGGTTNLFGGNQRPDVIGNPHVAHRTINQWFDPAAFGPTPPYTFGNAPRFFSNLRAPGYTNWDIAAEKNWYILEKLRLQGRAEFYNAFNHANFYAPNTNIDDKNGVATIRQAFEPRDIQFALKLYW